MESLVGLVLNCSKHKQKDPFKKPAGPRCKAKVRTCYYCCCCVCVCVCLCLCLCWCWCWCWCWRWCWCWCCPAPRSQQRLDQTARLLIRKVNTVRAVQLSASCLRSELNAQQLRPAPCCLSSCLSLSFLVLAESMAGQSTHSVLS